MAAASAVALAIGRLFAIAELYVFGAAALAACLVALVTVATTRAQVSASRRLVPERLTVGHGGRVELRVDNHGRRLRLPCTLTDPVAGTLGVQLTIGPLADGEPGRASYRVPTSRRGRLRVGPLRVDVVDPLGLARRQVATQPANDVVVVPRPLLPQPTSRTGGWQEPATGSGGVRTPTSTPAEVATLRPYVVGDDLRRIHWPSSAHTGDLQVRNDDQRWQGQVAALLDCRRSASDPDGFERLVSIAAGLIHQVATAGDQVRLVTTDGTDSGMVDAKRAASALLEQLALIDQHDDDRTRWPAPRSRGEDHLLLIALPQEQAALDAVLAPFGYRGTELVRAPSPAEAEVGLDG